MHNKIFTTFAFLIGFAATAVGAQVSNKVGVIERESQAMQIVDATGRGSPGFNPDAEVEKRADIASRIVAKWGSHVQETYKVSPEAWSGQISPFFKAASMATLQRALSAKNFNEMNNALSQNGAKGGISNSKALGEAATDLVYVPITPCRIFDTRLAGGVIAAGTTRGFDVTAVTDYSFQGGDASNCGGAGAAGSFAAAAINFTVVFPVGQGFITAYPFLGTRPTAATMVYRAGDLLSNMAIVKLDQGASSNEMNIYSANETHLVGDLVGYFINPQPTQLDCVEVASAGVDIAAGGAGSQSTAVCPTGYEITGGGCSSSTFDGKIVTSRSFDNSPTSQSHFCAFRNQGTGTANFVAYGRCCRIPGR
jgi:hypothetical protein